MNPIEDADIEKAMATFLNDSILGAVCFVIVIVICAALLVLGLMSCITVSMARVFGGYEDEANRTSQPDRVKSSHLI